MTSSTIPDGYLRDAKGRLVPENLVRPSDKLQDQLVAKMLGHADELSAQIARFKAHCFDDVGSFVDLLAEQYGVTRGGGKGNMSFNSYDGTLKVVIAVADHLTFGPELQVAKGLVDECIAEWSQGSNDQIKMLVQHAFQVDKEGRVSREAIFALRRIEIEDERWKHAMAAIGDSVRIEGSKTYIRFYRRATPEDSWRPVTIDLAAA
ncbi:DUF3164 family protein [Inquilinus sp.]|jgi:hypothetical protein|uniref:DUF3164 family protein n=1 Tax=Inquilinus sp. TaxID=1932117 RepID=UPI003783444A